MKLTTILLACLLSACMGQSQQTADILYRCLPCGSNCDKESYHAEGKCKDCGMELVPDSSINFTEVSPVNICNYISTHPGTILLDVRTKEEFEGKADPNFGSLKGAINIPIQELPKRISELEQYKGKEILVFCSHSRRSPRAAYLLSRQGFTKVVNMAGGMSVMQDPGCRNLGQ